MTRLPSSFALSSWLGFLAVDGATAVGGAGHPATGLFALGTAALLATAIVLLHSRNGVRERRGELLAFAGIGLCAAMVAAAALFGEPFGALFPRVDLAVWCIGLSLVALAFDAALHHPEDPEDELAYRRALLAVEASRRSGGRERDQP